MLRTRHACLSAALASSTSRGLMGVAPAARAAVAASAHHAPTPAASATVCLPRRCFVGVRYASSLAPASSLAHDNAGSPSPVPLPPAPPRLLPHFASVAHPQFLPPATDLAAGIPVLTRPGTELLKPARVPFKPHRALPPKIQAVLDSRLIDYRRRTHPEWLDKQHVRKMTLVERKALVRQHTQGKALASFIVRPVRLGHCTSLPWLRTAHSGSGSLVSFVVVFYFFASSFILPLSLE